MGLYLVFFGVPFLLGLFAQWRVKSAYDHWRRQPNQHRVSGAQAAAEMLTRAGVTEVRIEQTPGFLRDHYDPAAKVLRLSPEVYGGASVAAVGIACHEAGHALQHAQGYAFLGVRTLLVPTAKIGSWLALPLIMVGLLINALSLAWVGMVFFGVVVLFQFITLPVEFDASARAKIAVHQYGIAANPEEENGVSEVLNAAALTYVAATVAALAQLLYYLLLLQGRRR
jgi:Zn-dependent membrane protease YugP